MPRSVPSPRKRSLLLLAVHGLILVGGLRAQVPGTPPSEVGPQAIQAAAREGMSLPDLVQRDLPAVQFRQLSPATDAEPGSPAWDCVEYGVAAVAGPCRSIEVVVDGVLAPDPASLLRSTDLALLRRLEALSPEAALERYGNFGGRGVLLIETRGRALPPPTERAGSPPELAEIERYPFAHVLGRAFVVNALAVGLSYLPVNYCTHAWEGSFQIRGPRGNDGRRTLRCPELVATGAGVLALALPVPATALAARRAGTTERSRGTLLSVTLGALAHLSGHLLFFQGRAIGSGVLTAAGVGILSVGTPLVVTLADRSSRTPR